MRINLSSYASTIVDRNLVLINFNFEKLRLIVALETGNVTPIFTNI
jgi:hypothetical protein